jgi:hypothetical protein
VKWKLVTRFALTSTKLAVDGKTQIVYFAPEPYAVGGGTRLAIRISLNGRLIGVGYGGKTLHDRSQRKPGGERIRLPSAKARKCRDMACAAVAFLALGFDQAKFSIWEFDW